MKIASTAIGLVLALTAPALAADITIGSATEPSAIDPHFSRTGNNQTIAMQVFDRIASIDPNLQQHPAIAESWTNVEPTKWIVKVRANVKFHNGTPLTAEDVVFSLTRARSIPNSPAPFTGNVASIADMKIVDPLTIEFTTKAPTPDFIEQIGSVFVVSKAAAEGKRLEDFNNGSAAIGSGPYKFRSWAPGDRLLLTRNDDYWGRKPDFQNATIRFISNDAARIAALRSNSVDLIDAVPPEDAANIAKMPGLKVYSTASARLIYLALDTVRDEAPFVTTNDGKPLTPSPLKDVRVRTAISKMINRELIIDRILQGSGIPAGQIVPAGVSGHDPGIPAPTFDPDGAKKLMAEAGFPNGFGLTIHTSNDRFPGDAGIAQAIGQMLSRGGIKVNGVVAQPYNVYVGNASKQLFSAFIFSLGNTTPTSGPGLRNLFMTFNASQGTGAFNRLRYTNAKFDDKMREGFAEFDFDKRVQRFREATRIAFDDMAVVPLYWQKVHWAGKATIDYKTTMAEDTTAVDAHIAK
jgi:peptide/nickel transport system substrate-binding protein